MIFNRQRIQKEREYLHKLIRYTNKTIDMKVEFEDIFCKNPNIMVHNGCIISTLNKENHVYIAINEKAVDFDKSTAISVYSDEAYELAFEIESAGTKDVELHLIEYTIEGTKTGHVHVIGYNQTFKGKFTHTAAYIRCHMRVKGENIITAVRIVGGVVGYQEQPTQEYTCNQAVNGSQQLSVPAINSRDYDEQHVLSIDAAQDICYTEHEGIKIINNTVEVTQEQKGAYIALFENNITFGRLPQDKVLEVDHQYVYNFNFRGRSEVGIKTQLFVIFYSPTKREETYQVQLNRPTTLIPSQHSKLMRLALRVEGIGDIALDKIEITRVKKLDFIGYSNLKKLGYDQPKEIKDLKIACIFDEFTTECYRHSCELMPITPYDWKAQVTVKKPHVLMVESAWVGNNGVWARKVAYTGEDSIKELKELVQWCKDNGIPTVFWNKEDPVHYHLFINTAKMFDYIFTTDENKIDDYKKDTGNQEVYALPFAAQPKIHNPIKIREQRDRKACFAGSYYAAKYPERQEDISRLLDAAVNTCGIEIYDRHFGTSDKDFLFPERFREYVKGNLKPHELHIANKGYEIMINVNSVKESPTMFSRRVFEGLACGTPVVSSYSQGIDNIFEGLVVGSDSQQELEEEFIKLSTDRAYYINKQREGIRTVLKHHTYDHRLHQILDIIGMDVQRRLPQVDIVIDIEDIEQIDKSINMYNNQTYSNKKLLLLIEDEPQYIEQINKLQSDDIIFINKQYYNEHKVPVGRYIKGDYICQLSISDMYDAWHIEDLVLSLGYADADIIGRGKENIEYVYVYTMNFNGCIVSQNVFKEYTYQELAQLLDGKNIELFNRGYRLFTISSTDNKLDRKEEVL